MALNDARTLTAARRRRVSCRLQVTGMLAAIRAERGADMAGAARRASASIREFVATWNDGVEEDTADRLIADMWRNA